MALRAILSNPDFMTFLIIFVSLIALLFTIVQFVNMITNKNIKREVKGLYVIAFILFSFLTAVVYWFSKR